MNVGRYITDEAVRAAAASAPCRWEPSYRDHPDHEACGSEGACLDIAREQLGAALPTILAAHRRDVLREAADQIEETIAHADDSLIGRAAVAIRTADVRWLRAMADEAVADGR